MPVPRFFFRLWLFTPTPWEVLMFGCLRRVGCLVALLLAAVVGWMTRDLWWERVSGRRATPGPEWSTVHPATAPASRAKVEALSRKEGESFVSLTPAEVGALIFAAGGTRLSREVRDIRASADDQSLIVRGSVDLRSLRSVESLGPLAGLLTTRQVVTVRGVPRVAGPGEGRFEVETVKIGAVEVPAPALRTLLGQLDRGGVSPGLSRPLISFSLPLSVGDIRVTRGRVILYKRTP